MLLVLFIHQHNYIQPTVQLMIKVCGEDDSTENIDDRVSSYMYMQQQFGSTTNTNQHDENDDPLIDIDTLDNIYVKSCGCSK